jgi:hypothetical protein
VFGAQLSEFREIRIRVLLDERLELIKALVRDVGLDSASMRLRLHRPRLPELLHPPADARLTNLEALGDLLKTLVAQLVVLHNEPAQVRRFRYGHAYLRHPQIMPTIPDQAARSRL